MKTLVIASYYSDIYSYAICAQARRVLSNISHLGGWSIYYVAATDESEKATEAFNYCVELFKGKIHCKQIRIPVANTNTKVYKEENQLMLAQMTEAVLNEARLLEADHTWALEADILPASNALRCMQDVLNFDNHYYDIAFCTYPSNGGGSFLGGYGTPHSPINKDCIASERVVPQDKLDLLAKFDQEEKELISKNKRAEPSWVEAKKELDKEIEKCPPSGDIWSRNSKGGWRRRGWLDNAFPAIAKGAVVQVDWCGMGCTLLSKKALEVSHMDGYPGTGTQDLFLIWNRWYPAGLRIGLTTQALCDHVVKIKDENDTRSEKIVHMISFYETRGEAVGHIRWRPAPWYASDMGETFDPKNDGELRPIPALKAGIA